MRHFFIALLLLFLLAASGCKGEPCAGIAAPAHVKEMGVVLSGGILCKDGRGVANVDYPDKKPPDVIAEYKAKFAKDGFDVKSTSKSGKSLYARKGAKSFLIVGGISKERKVTFAVVKYCASDRCTSYLDKVATAMAKY